MMNIDPRKKEEDFNKFLISQYLKYGSVDAVLKKHYYALPISPASYHRLLDKNNIVKAAGPHGKMSEALAFMEYLAEEKLPLEELYKKLPPSFQTSKITLHRIYNHIKQDITRRAATGLVITVKNEAQKILTARDISMPNFVYGKKRGAISIPMTFSKKGENKTISAMRVLQQEVFSKNAVNGVVPVKISDKDLDLIFKIKILDISLFIYHLEIPVEIAGIQGFSSFRMKEYRFLSFAEIAQLANAGKLRSGVYEIVNVYRQKLMGGKVAQTQVALVNQRLGLRIQ